MARIRSIHPGLFTDEAFLAASMAARVLMVGVWTECWDDGVFEWKPLTLKVRLLPADNVDVGALLEELERLNIVRKFTAGGRQMGVVRNFCRFQRPKKANSSGLLPDELRTYAALSAASTEPGAPTSPTSSPPVPHQSPKVQTDGGEGRGEKGKERSKPDGLERARRAAHPPEKLKGSRISADWRPSEKNLADAAAAGLDETRIARESQRFRDFWLAKAGPNGVKRDWDAAWRNWVSKAAEWAENGQPQPSVKARRSRDQDDPPPDWPVRAGHWNKHRKWLPYWGDPLAIPPEFQHLFDPLPTLENT